MEEVAVIVDGIVILLTRVDPRVITRFLYRLNIVLVSKVQTIKKTKTKMAAGPHPLRLNFKPRKLLSVVVAEWFWVQLRLADGLFKEPTVPVLVL
jgi:hypothetical protein